MKNEAGQKVRQILRKEYMLGSDMFVVTYIFDKGWTKLQNATEEQIKELIEELDGYSFFTKEFKQSMVNAAIRICKECSLVYEFLPYIVNHLDVPNAKMKEIEIHQDELTKWRWGELIDSLDVEYEENADEIKSIIINANVIETNYK